MPKEQRLTLGSYSKKWIISPSKLNGFIKIPPSKSQSIRALLFGLLAKGKSEIRNLLPCPEMIQACHLLGAEVESSTHLVTIKGVGGNIKEAKIIDAGNSGLILRLIGAVAALGTKPTVITGDRSIQHLRPILPLLDGLTQLGAKAFSLKQNGKAPILVQGPLFSGHATIHGEDSQPVSALLIASAFSNGAFKISVIDQGELPWIQLTLHWFDKLGICYKQKQAEYELFGKNSIEGFSYNVPGDFSSLAFPVAAALVTHSEIRVENLDFSDPQGDKKLIAILQQMGANLEIMENALRVKKTPTLKGITIHVNDCIDALPILATLGCFAEGKTELIGGKIARKKECDRIHAMAQELKKMGGNIEEKEDGLIIYPSFLKGSALESYRDHRIAMALAVAAMGAKGKTIICDVACVNKTFPYFQEQMNQLGASIQ